MKETILENKIGAATIIISNRLTGPRGSRAWKTQLLSDGRTVIIGPDTHGNGVPNWISNKFPAKTQFERAGGSTYKWSAWITKAL